MLKAKLPEFSAKVNKSTIYPAEFEKDDETNFHVDFVHAFSCLRARNYQITECDIGKTKMIAGSIIPAIATTTAMITGVVMGEIYKFVQGITDLAKFKNSFVNLAIPFLMFTEPDEIGRKKSTKEFNEVTQSGPTKAIPEGFTIYDKVVVNQGSMTI